MLHFKFDGITAHLHSFLCSHVLFPAFCAYLRTAQKKEEAELARAREAEKAARSYDSLFSGEGVEEEEEDTPRKSVREMEEDFM